ncbi:Heavy metal RND efflux outer membrane protein, CzcC family [hydrothermal vent metagenome]|uniref:Heavy metal RND efflux outer membrane protein, CzcC family n=1 Tax=hydrothermal vent metagenome TaxID=652676 RepID=A0A1W1D0G9_9ZZZZ
MNPKSILLFFFISLSLYAQSLQELIDYSKQNNYQMQILQEESEIIEREADIVRAWADPVLKAGINDVQAVRPFSRNEEAMQNQFISLSQAIPLNNRLELASDVEKEKLVVLEHKKEILNVNIAFGVKKAFIEAQYAKSNLRILDDYINFLKTPMNLLVNLSAVERNSVEKYIKTQLLQKNYQLQREAWLRNIEIAKERIELIGNIKIDDFSDEVMLKNYHYKTVEELLSILEMNSPELHMRDALKNVANKDIELARAKEQADFTVTGGYYQRFDRNDYVSIAVSFPLYINKKQKNQTVQAMKKSNIQNITYEQTRVQLEQGLKITFHKLQSLYDEVEILEQSSVKINQLIANAKSELASGGSLVHYFELFTQRVNNKLSINKKRLAIALNENQIDQLLGVAQ